MLEFNFQNDVDNMARIAALLYAVAAHLLFAAVYVYFIGFVGDVGVPRSIDRGPLAPPLTAALIDLALLALFALQHTLMARPAFKQSLSRLLPAVMERATYVLLSSLLLALLCWQWRPLPATVWQIDHELLQTLLLAVFALGWVLGLVAAAAFDLLALFGLRQALLNLYGGQLGPSRFSRPGPYALVRHPMMTGFLLSFWATPHMSVGHLLFALVMTAYIYIALRFFEERDLRAALGDDYARYQREVPMLLPRWRTRR